MGARRVIHLHRTRKVIEDVGKQQNAVIEMIICLLQLIMCMLSLSDAVLGPTAYLLMLFKKRISLFKKYSLQSVFLLCQNETIMCFTYDRQCFKCIRK